MEEDILQVVKYCTDLIDDKDLEKLDLIIKYMKRYSVHYRGLYFLPAFCRCASFHHLTSISFPQTHAAVGGVCVEHGLRLHPGQRAGGGAAGLRQHLKDNMKAKVYWFSKSSESSKSWLFFTSKVTTLQLSPKRSQWPPETRTTDSTHLQRITFFGNVNQQKTNRNTGTTFWIHTTSQRM